MTRLSQQVFRSSGFYPITAFYLVAVALATLVVRGAITWLWGLVLLSLAACIALLFAAYRETVKIREMVDGQRSEMLAGLKEMREMLQDHGIAPPKPGPGERQARRQDAQAEDEKE